MKALKFAMAAAIVSGGFCPSLHAASDPSSILITVYGVAVSTSLDCTNPLTIFESTNGVQKDFLKNPVLGGGNIPDGTYPCVMINMSDNIDFVAASNDGANCTAGTRYTIDICRTDNSGATTYRTGTTFGTSTACTGNSTTPAADRVTLFLRTNSVGTSNFTKPANAGDTASGLPLTSAFVVSGTSTAKFVLDARGQVASGGGQCGLNAPTFGFR